MNFMKSVINGSDSLAPDVKSILSRKGDATIYSIKVGRTPVQSMITGIIKIVSTTPYDTLFHLFIQMTTSKGLILLQKNARINMMEGHSTDIENAEWLDVPNVPQITVNQLIENTRNQMGNKFIPYSPSGNNCQDFIMNVLTSNGMNDPTVLDFVKQDTKSIFTSPWFRKFARSVTNLGGSFDVLMQGGELHRNFKNNELTNNQLRDIMNGYRIPLNGIYIKDQMPTRLRNGAYIVNLNGVSHWTALLKNGDDYYYFDSFGMGPPIDVEKKISKKYIWSDKQLQNIDSSSCGWFVAAFLRSMSKAKNLEKGYESFIKLFKNKTADNEAILKALLR